MSVREEDRNKNCPSRGLGIAAAAIGVGVGAALYYIFSKRSENPADGGATSSSWSCEDQALHHNHDSSYSTISEHSTTDTSINSTSSEDILQQINRRLWHRSDSISQSDESESDERQSQSDEHVSDSDDEEYDHDDIGSDYDHDDIGSGYDDNIQSDDETNMEWDVTRSSLDVPVEQSRSRSPMMMQFGELTVSLRNRVQKSAQMEINKRRERNFREREWTLEECSICFDVMQREQEVLALGCTHRFHQACILPWLEQQQTCPVCRKAS